MKKKLFILSLITILSINIEAGILGGGGSSGLGKILKIVTKISEQQHLMQLEQAQQSLQFANQIANQIEQIQNQMKSLQNEAMNLKALGKEISKGNLDAINQGLDKILYLKAETQSIFYKSEDLNRKFSELYQNDIQIEKNFARTNNIYEGIKENNKRLAKIREQTQHVVYDAMKQADFTPKLNADKRNVEMLMERSSTTEGALQAIQAGNAILGQLASILIDIREVLSTSVISANAIQAEINQMNSSEVIAKEKLENDYVENQKNNEDEIKKSLDKLEEFDISKWGNF